MNALVKPGAASLPRRRLADARAVQIARRAWGTSNGKVGYVILAVLLLLSVLAPWIVPFDPVHQDLGQGNVAPFWLGDGGHFIFGTDNLGRDVFSRVLYGLRLSLAIGIVTATASAMLGLLLGLLAGYYDRSLGYVLMRIADVQFAIPFVVVAIALTAVMGPGLFKLMVVLAVWGWTVYARTIANTVTQVSKQDFVTAARTMGASTPRILWHHITPMVFGPVLVLWSTSAGVLVLVESALSLLGLGVQAPGFSLGSMLSEGRVLLRLSWWSVVFPGVTLMLIVLAFNMLGDALRDALTPGTSTRPVNPELT
jgi:peptide/nickel transport system permease protein